LLIDHVDAVYSRLADEPHNFSQRLISATVHQSCIEPCAVFVVSACRKVTRG
jgi:hypothetical protein